MIWKIILAHGTPDVVHGTPDVAYGTLGHRGTPGWEVLP